MKIENFKLEPNNLKPHILPILKRLVFLILIALFLTTTVSVSAQTGDSTPPTTSHELDPATPDGESDWYKRTVGVTLSAYDSSSGVAEINWRIGNDGPWQKESFSSTQNLLQNTNPSFESGSGSTIEKWESAGTEGAVFLHDGTVAYEGSYSAKITNTTSDWGGWNNRSEYVPDVDFGDNMIASIRVKTDNVVGDGAYFTIYAFTCSGESLPIKDSETKITGTTPGWAIISEEFIVSVNDVCGIYLDIGLNGTGTVWIDNASLIEGVEDTSTDFIISQNGDFNLEYYSVDREGNEELPHHFVPLKIDTRAPGSWRDFETEVVPREGNDHTLISRITVSDETSGLQDNTDKFQYSVNAGETWGYYEDLLQCIPETWHEGGWRDDLDSLFNSGDNDALLETPQVDYCNSDWKVCKTIRFYIKDVAGHEAYKDICINGAWSQTSGQGDVYAHDGINFSASGAGDNTDGLVISGGDITNFTSSQGWVVTNYTLNSNKLIYTEWLEQFPSPTSLTGGLPNTDGVFITNTFTIETKTIPDNLSYQETEFEAVVLISDDLIINDSYSLGSKGALVFIVGGDVVIDKSVNDIAGMFFVDGKVTTGGTAGGNDTLNIYGSILTGSISLDRSLSKQANSNDPAELFIYEPKYLELMADLLSDEQKLLRWFEVGL